MAENKAQEAESVLDRVLSQAPAKPEKAEVDAAACYNCQVQGQGNTKLKNGVCPKCGYVKPR